MSSFNIYMCGVGGQGKLEAVVLPGHHLDHLAQHQKPGVGVGPLGAWLELQLLAFREPDVRGEPSAVRNQLGFAFPEPPVVPEGSADPELVETIDRLFGSLQDGIDTTALTDIATSEDPRAAWLISDLLRFFGPGPVFEIGQASFERLTGADLSADPIAARSPWQSMTDHLIAWDLPALPDYARWKGQLYTLVDPRWQAFFDDQDAAVDWRLVDEIVPRSRFAETVAERARDAVRVGDRLRVRGGAHRPLIAHHRVVVHAMIGALELEDLVALAIDASKAHREEGRLAAAAVQAHHFSAGHVLDDLLAELGPG